MAVYYIYGTSNSGSTFGIKGFYSPLYLTQSAANAADLAQTGGTGTSHSHTFDEVIGVTFWMPTTGAVHPTGSDEGSAPTGQYSGETYISYTSPISDADIEPINFGVLAGDTFNSWRRKTNEVARNAILNKATVSSIDTRFTRLIDVTGGEDNIMTLTSGDNITGEKQFEGLVKFTAAVDSTNAIQIGSNGKLYVSGSKILFDNDIDLHTAGAEIKASSIDLPTGIAKYSGVEYIWPNQAPVPGQILQSGSNNNLSWVNNPAAEAQVEAFVIEDPNPIGSILQWTLIDAPSKWLKCDGSLVNRETTGVEGESGYAKGYPELFAIIGETYGAGDGSTTFQLPNLQGRVPIGLGTTQDSNNLQAQFGVIGGTTGVLRPGSGNSETINGEYERSTTHTITIDEMPAHTHGGVMRYPYNGGSRTEQNQKGRPEDYVSYNRSTNSAGGNQPMTFTNQTVQPFIVLNYVIKAESSSIVTQNVQPGNGLLINGQRATANLLAANSENSITLDVDTDDFEFDSTNGQLKLVDTNYRSGEVIETFGGPCDGRSVTVVSGTHTLPDVNALVGTSGTTLLEACKMNYTPPAGTKHVRLEITFGVESLDNEHIAYYYPSISTESDTVLIPSKYYSFSRQQYGTKTARLNITVVATYTIDSTISSENNSSIYNQILKSWTSSRAIGFSVNAHSTGYDVRLFEDHNQTTAPGKIDDEFDTRDATDLVEPHITITAIAG